MNYGRYASFESALKAYTKAKENYYKVDWEVHRGKYTDEEDDLIMHSKKTVREIAKQLGRTVKGIERRRHALKYGGKN